MTVTTWPSNPGAFSLALEASRSQPQLLAQAGFVDAVAVDVDVERGPFREVAVGRRAQPVVNPLQLVVQADGVAGQKLDDGEAVKPFVPWSTTADL
jgi:hypothetical protein